MSEEMQMNAYYIPHVIEKSGNRERAYDIYSRLMKDRIIFIGTPINDGVANAVTAQLLFLSLQSKKPISIYINSPGGGVTAGMAIYDTMKHIRNRIETYCIGQCASMGAVLLTAGTKGHRFALPHSQIMIHQPFGGTQGSATDVEIAAKNIIKWKRTLNTIIAECTGKEVEKVEKDTDRDNYMTPEEAKEYGIIDEVLTQVEKSDNDEDEDEDDEDEDGETKGNAFDSRQQKDD